MSSSDTATLSLVIGGHVDHGKSTIIGRLLADTGSLPEGRLEQVRALCERTGRPFEYAFLLDALKDEQAQGITIDAARVFFRTARRPYIIIDAPGHTEFLRNMVTGASRADAALLVIDAQEGVRENSRRHGYLMAMLGLRQVAVLVNKMDLVGHDSVTFDRIVTEYTAFLARLGVVPVGFVPVSGREGENITSSAAAMPWYRGPTVLETLDRFEGELPEIDKPLRLSVQDVYKFARHDDRRLVVGSVATGRLRVGDQVVFYPSGKSSHVQAIEAFNRLPQVEVAAGEAAAFTLTEQVYVRRGELVAVSGEPRPAVATRIRASVFWLGRDALIRDRDYILKLGAARVPVRVESVHRVLDANSLEATESKQQVDRHEVAELTLRALRPIAFDLAVHAAATSRFVLLDGYEISGGGIVREALDDAMSEARERVLKRNVKWEPSTIPAEHRVQRYRQRPALLLCTGASPESRKHTGKMIEVGLFERGHWVYYLGMANVLYGVDADLDRNATTRQEHLRRLGEVANLMLDAGLLLVVTTADLSTEELALLQTTLGDNPILLLWVGTPPADAETVHLTIAVDEPNPAAAVVDLLVDRGILPSTPGGR